jgi:hypothetical protein
LLGGFNSGAYSFYPNGLAEWDTLKTVLRMTTTRIPLVLTYQHSLEKISGIARHHWKEIEKSETRPSYSLNQPL